MMSNKLHNLKIGARLGLGFGLVMLLLSVSTIIGINSLRNINEKLDHIVKVNYVKIKLANDITEAVTGVVGNLRSMLLTDHAARVGAKQEIERLRGEYRVALEKLEKLEKNDRGKELIAKAKGAIDATKNANNRVIELSLAGKTGDSS